MGITDVINSPVNTPRECAIISRTSFGQLYTVVCRQLTSAQLVVPLRFIDSPLPQPGPSIVSSRATPAARAACEKSGQGFEQRFGVHEVRCREAFRVRGIDYRERGAGLFTAGLPLPESGQAHRRPQFPCPALLTPGRLDSLAEAALGSSALVGRLGH